MKKRVKHVYAAYILLGMPWHICSNNDATFFKYQYALVRDLSDSFQDSLKLQQPIDPINVALAKQQHEQYIQLLKDVIPNIIRLAADIHYPDCNFIEDTAVIIHDTVIISTMGAPERRGEEIAVAHIFRHLRKNVIYLQEPATMDGGDILYTGTHLFVGISKRTNSYALQQLERIFGNTLHVIGIPVHEGLHLKSLITCFDTQTFIVADNHAGREIAKNIEAVTNNSYNFIIVPDAVASNVLRVANTLIIQDGFPESEKVLEALCKEKAIQLIKITMSELIKADGALTCGSLLFK